MRRVKRFFGSLRRVDHVALVVLTVLFLSSLFGLLRRFQEEETILVPSAGGTYIEGSVGTVRNLMPWFTVMNDVNRDASSLIFCAMQRYNPFTRSIEDDAASVTVSDGGRTYTARLRPGVFWHDTLPDHPRPVTADDVLFTYRTIQQQGFVNPVLQKNFRGVEVAKVDERTVRFTLDRPYGFFRSNLTLGLVPAHHFEGVPAERVHEALDFAFSPVGCGPYRFVTLLETDLSTEITLERFDVFYGAKPNIDRIVLRAFPDYRSLLSDIRNLHGVRNVPHRPDGAPIIPKRFRTFSYTLPQYVALFFNLDHSVLIDPRLRLALQLAIDKQAIVERIGERTIIDTPLLELRQDDWVYHFDAQAARGALFESSWHLPEKLRLQHLLEVRERNIRGILRLPDSIAMLGTGSQLVVTGSLLHPELSAHLPRVPSSETLPFLLNGLPVRRHLGHGTGVWVTQLPTDGSTGSILPGENGIRLTLEDGDVLDTFTLTRVTSESLLRALRAEQQLVDRFLASKKVSEDGDGSSSEDRITVESLFNARGVLRRRRFTDPVSIRMTERGEALHLTMLTSPLPPAYSTVAQFVADQWRALGVAVTVVVPEDRAEFERRVIERDYDVLLFGQPLLDNLDSYPFWHSSQVQVAAGEGEELRLDAHNFSQYRSFEADALLEQIRTTSNLQVRTAALQKLATVFRRDVPAVVLYSPTYLFAVREDVLGVDLGFPSLHSDRFLTLHRWFLEQRRVFKPGYSWRSFFSWLPSVWER